MADLADTIQDAAETPQSVTVDGQSVSERSIGDLIAADRYAKACAAASTTNRGIRFSRIALPAQVNIGDADDLANINRLS